MIKTLIPLIVFIFSFHNFGQVNIEKLRFDDDSSKVIIGQLNSDFTVKSGNTDILMLGVGGRVEFNWFPSYSFIALKLEFGKKDGEQFTNDYFMHLRHVVPLTNFFSLEGFFQFNADKIKKIRDRELIGGGVRIAPLITDTWKVRLGISAFLEHEVYDIPVSFAHPIEVTLVRGSTYISWSYTADKIFGISSITYYQPAFNDFSDYRILSENILDVKVGKNFSINVKFNLVYDSAPVDNVKPQDIDSRYGFTYRF